MDIYLTFSDSPHLGHPHEPWASTWLGAVDHGYQHGFQGHLLFRHLVIAQNQGDCAAGQRVGCAAAHTTL